MSKKIYLSFTPHDITVAQTFNQHMEQLLEEHHLPYQIVNQFWNGHMQEHLHQSRFFLALVSPEYLVDSLLDEERELAFALATRRALTIRPILLSSCFYEYHPIGKYPFLPRQKDTNRQRSVKNTSNGWKEVYQGILTQLTQ